MPGNPLDASSARPDFPQPDPIERIVLRSMNEGVITLECNGTIYSANPAARRILGLDRNDMVGKNFAAVFDGHEDNAEFADIFRQALLATSAMDRKETRFRRSDGQAVDLSVTSSSLEVDACEPSMQTVVVVLRDITPLKSLERAKRRAANHLSHELKTPLAIIKASINNLLTKEVSKEHMVRILDRIRRNIDRLANIQMVVEEAIDPPPFKPTACRVTELLEQILEDLRAQTTTRSVSLRLDSQIEETDLIDPSFLPLIVRTLVKNAVENTPDGGEVVVSLRPVGSQLMLEVADSGIGITVQDEPFVFEGFLYTQATEDYSSKRPYEFNAGGKGLELLRLKIFSEAGYFDISFTTRRCKHIPTDLDHCPGEIDRCQHVQSLEQCKDAGGTTFRVLFRG